MIKLFREKNLIYRKILNYYQHDCFMWYDCVFGIFFSLFFASFKSSVMIMKNN